MSTLPDLPSELLSLALTDLEKCEADPKFIIDMHAWYVPQLDGNTCRVCLAGAVMACELNLPSVRPGEYQTTPGDLDDSTISEKLRALDYFRQGYISHALYSLGYTYDQINTQYKSIPSYLEVFIYNHDPDIFKADMRSLIALLQENGL